jgi:hypothetical protein
MKTARAELQLMQVGALQKKAGLQEALALMHMMIARVTLDPTAALLAQHSADLAISTNESARALVSDALREVSS